MALFLVSCPFIAAAVLEAFRQLRWIMLDVWGVRQVMAAYMMRSNPHYQMVTESS